MGSEGSLWALVMDVLCLRWLGSGVEGAAALRWGGAALRWATPDSGTVRLVRVPALLVRCADPVRSAGGGGAVWTRSRSRRWSMVISSLGPSGRPWRVAASSANDKSHMAASLGNLTIPDAAMVLSARCSIGHQERLGLLRSSFKPQTAINCRFYITRFSLPAVSSAPPVQRDNAVKY